MIKDKIQDIKEDANAELLKARAKIKRLEADGNKDSVTFWQLLGWSGAAAILGIIIGLLI